MILPASQTSEGAAVYFNEWPVRGFTTRPLATPLGALGPHLRALEPHLGVRRFRARCVAALLVQLCDRVDEVGALVRERRELDAQPGLSVSYARDFVLENSNAEKPMTLEQVGQIIGVTKERVREVRGIGHAVQPVEEGTHGLIATKPQTFDEFVLVDPAVILASKARREFA